jgi:hypothetical protein
MTDERPARAGVCVVAIGFWLASSAGHGLLAQRATEPVARISWQLVDDTARALHSTRLPSAAPALETWRSEFGLTLEGQATVEFIIRAHVIEAALCTPQIRCPSPR